ncbi:hypothetical protein GJA_5316 [Janthinobacterium agaricidamnosum NBRC 102515 = DSM 9628]|uniref:Uncharacterized protein n=1 Tax=Janthinobacterium agaricidamnosum NBRC 102515 = DSM 9628 TaxID=1349767 RepID=W0VEY2_9BURK|nr:hypothetical protein GJA_5316 [Janthinobacterium agaricidamnosum NBRC 102515 = DSM 9628]
MANNSFHILSLLKNRHLNQCIKIITSIKNHVHISFYYVNNFKK